MSIYAWHFRNRFKKMFVFIMSISVLFMLSSCEKSMVDPSVFDETVRKANPMMFYDENHEHDIRYQYIAHHDLDAENGKSVYHYVYCTNENCDFEPYTEPHTIKKSMHSSGNGSWIEGFLGGMNLKKENGYFYHRIVMSCAYCDAGIDQRAYIELWTLCNKQISVCNGDEYTNMSFPEWREYLHQYTPYELEPD